MKDSWRKFYLSYGKLSRYLTLFFILPKFGIPKVDNELQTIINLVTDPYRKSGHDILSDMENV